MSGEKLPEWPTANWGSYETQYNMARAALARMEALVEYAEHQWSCVKDRGHPCDCGLDELLAACARKEAGAMSEKIDLADVQEDAELLNDVELLALVRAVRAAKVLNDTPASVNNWKALDAALAPFTDSAEGQA